MYILFVDNYMSEQMASYFFRSGFSISPRVILQIHHRLGARVLVVCCSNLGMSRFICHQHRLAGRGAIIACRLHKYLTIRQI